MNALHMYRLYKKCILKVYNFFFFLLNLHTNLWLRSSHPTYVPYTFLCNIKLMTYVFVKIVIIISFFLGTGSYLADTESLDHMNFKLWNSSILSCKIEVNISIYGPDKDQTSYTYNTD